MRKVYQKYPDDPNIGALFAESLMDLHPWNLWQKDGTIQPWTPEIMTVLEKCLKQDSLHVGANHFYIHATEMSNTAELADASARRLETLVPGTGRYHDGVVANQKAVEVDSLYFVACHAQGVYPLAYYPHNHHFIAACATFSGESKLAMIGANATADHAHKKLLRETAWATLQHYYAIPWYVMVKLGLWDDIKRSPKPEPDLKYPTIVWNYAQGMANLAGGKTEDASKNLSAIKEIIKDTAHLQEITIWGINTIFDVCVIAEDVLEGELLASQKNYSQAISLLRETVKAEDALNYDEPPDWFFSVRHHLGAILVVAGKYKEAEQIYLEDLKIYRENGWALKGLMNVYAKTGDKKKLEQATKRFETAWAFADIKINSSRIL
jgi:tetratricopeptide (TPR) repeat protein